MSVISSTHDVVSFVSGKTAPMAGQRLAKVGYKSTKKTPARFKNVAVSIPQIQSEWIKDSRLSAHIRVMLENAQDGLIKSLYEAKLGQLTTVNDSEITIDSIVAFMDAEETGGRLTKESIQNWFKTTLQETLFVFIAEKLKFVSDDSVELTEAQTDVVNQHVRVFADVMGMLAGGATVLADKQIAGCRNALALVEEDELSIKLGKRLDAMEKPAQVADMIDLS